MSRTKKTLIGAASIFLVAILAVTALSAFAPVSVSLAQSPTAAAPTPGGQTNQIPGTSTTNPWTAIQDAFMNALATRLGTTVDKIKEALVGAFGDAIDMAVKNGLLTQDQATQLKSDATNRFSQGIPLPGFGKGGFGGFSGPDGFRGRGGFHGEIDLAAIATALNMNQTDLMTELQSGKTLAQVVTEKGADLNQVKTSALANLKTKLDAAVASGQLTQAQADAMYNQAGTNFDTMANQAWTQGEFFGKRGFGPGGFGHGGFGPRGFGGFREGFDFASIASALNMNVSDLMTELQSGKTLAQVVTEKGGDLATIKTNLLATLKSRLDQAVAAGSLTQAQADAMYNEASANFDAMVNQTWNQGLPSNPSSPSNQTSPSNQGGTSIQGGWPKE